MPIELFIWRIQTRVLQNDLLLRLCRLDDDGSTQHSLREALRSTRRSLPNQKAVEIDKRLQRYRQLINPIKTKARNYYLAHLSKATDVPKATDTTELLGSIKKQISEAREVFDLIAGDGEPIKYILKAESLHRELDLRKELFKSGR